MYVEDAMQTELITGTPSEPVHSIVEKMVSNHCGVIPIIDEDKALIGVISMKDVMMPMFATEAEVFQEDVHAMNFQEMEEEYANVLSLSAADVMTRHPLSVTPQYPLLRAASVMGLKNLRRIPVTNDGKLVGVISIGDINRRLFLRMKEQKQSINA